MKKLKIVFYAVLGVIIISLVIILVIQIKAKHTLEKEVIELNYSQTKTIFELEKLEIRFKSQIDTANYYRDKNKGHEKKLDSIYITAMADSDELVLQFFTDRYSKKPIRFKKD